MKSVVYDRVTDYATRVVNGQVEGVGQLHILACKRHLNDLARQKTKKFPYYWSVEASQRIIDYAETLTIAEGSEPKPVKLLDCQAFDIGCTFGWLKVSNDKRRFRRRYKSMARQQGKSFENGIMGTYIAEFGNYQYGKLFTVATKKRQARIVWEEMAKFIRIDKDLSELFEIKDYISYIKAKDTGCTIEALSKDAGLDDGFRSIFASLDEIHQHKDNKLYQSMYRGTRQLPETLISMITTRGDKLNSFCKEIDDYCINILNGVTTAEDFFVDIYCLDKGDDIWDERNWSKANPLSVTTEEGLEQLRTDAQTAKDMGGAELRDFLTKCLNLWVQNTDDLFINPENWKNCGSDRKLKDFVGRDCYLGIDLSSGGDLTSIALEFEAPDDRYYIYSHSFMPRGRLQEHVESDLAPYDIWEQQGLITVTGGAMDFKNDYKFIISHVKGLIEQYDLNIKAIGVDPHNFDGIRTELEEITDRVFTVTQSARALNDATVDMRLTVKSEKVEYDRENELMSWSFANATVVENSFKEIKVDKKNDQRTARIDVVDAVIDAHHVLLKDKAEESPIDIDFEMDRYLELMGWKGGSE